MAYKLSERLNQDDHNHNISYINDNSGDHNNLDHNNLDHNDNNSKDKIDFTFAVGIKSLKATISYKDVMVGWKQEK